MDQIKIGKFIAELRKEQGYTQLDLATKLGVTDRAVSKWENGRGLPDISLIKPLCDALSISVNELLSGQKIEKECITEKAEENLINTLNYSEKSIKKTKAVFLRILAGIAAFVIVFVSFFAIDVSRMRDNKPVVFSTWGIDYFPPINLDNEKINLAIKEYLIERGDSEEKDQDGVKTFVAIKTYLLEETQVGKKFNVYAWVLSEQCYKDKNDIMNYGSFSIPYKFTVEKESDTAEAFEVVDAACPRDNYYAEDMKTLFPKSVRREMDKIHKDGSYERLEMQNNEDIELYFQYDQ